MMILIHGLAGTRGLIACRILIYGSQNLISENSLRIHSFTSSISFLSPSFQALHSPIIIPILLVSLILSTYSLLQSLLSTFLSPPSSLHSPFYTFPSPFYTLLSHPSLMRKFAKLEGFFYYFNSKN